MLRRPAANNLTETSDEEPRPNRVLSRHVKNLQRDKSSRRASSVRAKKRRRYRASANSPRRRDKANLNRNAVQNPPRHGKNVRRNASSAKIAPRVPRVWKDLMRAISDERNIKSDC